MMRKFTGILAGVLLVTGAVTPVALATHSNGDKESPPAPHEAMPDNQPTITNVKGACEVAGEVAIDELDGAKQPTGNGGVSAEEANHNHFSFIDTVIVCEGTDENLLGDDLIEAFTVEASGATDGCHPAAGGNVQNCSNDSKDPNQTGHGEWDGIGWSHGDNFAGNNVAACGKNGTSTQNLGEIEVRANDIDKDAEGWVKFVRVGTVVDAWGALDWEEPGKKVDCFRAQLDFIPTDTDGKVNTAMLAGTAVVGN